MTLENLVPPLELCKQIPAGHFDDSALVWSYSCDKRKTEPFVEERDCIDFCRRDMINTPPVYPAPTLAEIMLALADITGYEIPAVYRDSDSSWYVEIKNSTEDRYHNRSHKDNAASAALKLWLDLSVKEKNA